MGNLNASGKYNIADCDFVVYQTNMLWVTRVPFDRSYYETKLFPALHHWYFDLFLPAATKYYNRDYSTAADDVATAAAAAKDDVGLDID